MEKLEDEKTFKPTKEGFKKYKKNIEVINNIARVIIIPYFIVFIISTYYQNSIGLIISLPPLMFNGLIILLIAVCYSDRELIKRYESHLKIKNEILENKEYYKRYERELK